MASESAHGCGRDRAPARCRGGIQERPPTPLRPPDRARLVYDLERLISRVSLGAANARDLLALKQSFAALPRIKELLSRCDSQADLRYGRGWDDLGDVFQLIDKAIHDDPPYTLREGKLIKKGYNAELDELRSISSEGKGWIAGIELRERERTGISSLKVSYNRVFGYYIEVTKTNLANVPQDFIRKQTLANAERFITPELKEYEEKVLGAEEKILDLEYRLFQQVRESVAASTVRIQDMARRLAILDCLVSLAEAAAKNNYTRPVDPRRRYRSRSSKAGTRWSNSSRRKSGSFRTTRCSTARRTSL